MSEERNLLNVADHLVRRDDTTIAELYHLKQNTLVLNVEITGLEKHDFGGQRVECLVVDYKGFKGVIPKSETEFMLDRNLRLKDYLGEEIPVVVAHIEEEAKMVAMSHKAAKEVMFRIALKNFRPGNSYPAVIRFVSPFRVVAELLGVQFSFNANLLKVRNNDMLSFFKKGDEIDVEIVEINRQEQKIVATPVRKNPFSLVGEKYKKGGSYLGRVKRQFNAGYWVELEPGLDVYCPFPRAFDFLAENTRVVIDLERVDNVRQRLSGKITDVKSRS